MQEAGTLLSLTDNGKGASVSQQPVFAAVSFNGAKNEQQVSRRRLSCI